MTIEEEVVSELEKAENIIIEAGKRFANKADFLNRDHVAIKNIVNSLAELLKAQKNIKG